MKWLQCVAATERPKQEERVREVYKRRLAIPLLDMEAAHARYAAWEDSRLSAEPEPSAPPQKKPTPRQEVSSAMRTLDGALGGSPSERSPPPHDCGPVSPLTPHTRLAPRACAPLAGAEGV